ARVDARAGVDAPAGSDARGRRAVLCGGGRAGWHPGAMGSRVISLGHYQPSRILTNAELATMVDTTDEWITRRVGIRARHLAEPGETVADMAARAGAKALASAGLDAADIDLVLVATTTAHERSPSNAARVAAHLGVLAPAAIDVN